MLGNAPNYYESIKASGKSIEHSTSLQDVKMRNHSYGGWALGCTNGTLDTYSGI